MSDARMSLTVQDGLARLTLVNGARGNPIDAQFCADLSEAAITLSEDRAVRCVLVTAEGKAFGYGGDVSSFVGDLDALPANIKRWTTTFHSAIARLQRMDAPLVTAVQGVCAGGMAAFVAGSDILIAAPDAKFVAAYAGIGFSNDGGSSVMFARRMGQARTRRFLLLNETLDAGAALSAGLVDELADDSLARAEAVARQLAAGPTRAYGEIRRLMNSVTDQPLETQLELEAQGLARVAGTADAREGIVAFSERRAAQFTGA